VTASVDFAGAPATGPTSIYTGPQLIIIKTDGSTFPNADPWKCVTCGVPEENRRELNGDLGHPQPFPDGRRIAMGTNVLECSADLVSEDCTPENVRIFPIRWNVTPDGEGPGGNMRESRLNPDGVHFGWNHVVTTATKYDQFSYVGRLVFNESPDSGLPAVPRYDLADVSLLYDEAEDVQPLRPDPENPDELLLNPLTRSVGEFRGFTSDGLQAIYIGYPSESDNIDLFAAHLVTGEVTRLTAHPEYVDPVGVAPDGNGGVFEDTRGTDRQMFLAAMRGIPPLNDLITTGAVSSVRNDGGRRFFRPILIDRYGDRGDYFGQELNAGDGEPGSLSDPDWNVLADPVWSTDGTSVAYREAAAPGATSNEPGRLPTRYVIVRFTDREPIQYEPPPPIPDEIPWATPYEPGDPDPVRTLAPAGTWTLRGTVAGDAEVTIDHDPTGTFVERVAVEYRNFTDDGVNVINGTERVRQLPSPSLTTERLLWHSDLRSTGCQTGRKFTSDDGFLLTIDLLENVFNAQGTLTTTIDGITYRQPANGA
jgi:hypothetical protein